MKKKRHISFLLLLTLSVLSVFAQYPHYFLYDNEDGLPNNEVYSIIQDKKGFIWIGCDAGLFKFDGVRYTSYKCTTQNSKSISNLTVSPAGTIYCVNFQDQIFYLENDTLKELRHTLQKISNITNHKNGLLYANHGSGVSVFNPQTNEWKTINGISDFTRAVSVNNENEVYFLAQQGVGELSGSVANIIPLPNHETDVASHFLMACHQKAVWVFKRDETLFYMLKDEQVIKNGSNNLRLALRNRKITNIKSLSDGKLWVTTYNGIICYDVNQDLATVFYPELSFSDVLIDRESNYWFTTLHTGILRVPDLNFLVWNKTNPDIKNDKLSHVEADSAHIYFSSVNGTIGRLNTIDQSLQIFHTGKNADIECLFVDPNDNSLLFNLLNHSYTLKNDQIKTIPFQTDAIKTIVHTPRLYFLGTSFGLYAERENSRMKINDVWTRQLAWNKQENALYAATNEGLQVFENKENHWVCTDTFFAETQIISIDFIEKTQQLFALTFDGKIFLNNVEVAELLKAQANKLKYYNSKIYVASNKGLWIYDLSKKEWSSINTLSGLASESIQDLLILGNNVWLATGKGLQRIPLSGISEDPLAKIHLKNSKTNIQLAYGQLLILFPETSIYRANGKFEYAYHINKQEWIKLPASIEQIEIQNLPAGNFEIELKAIDHLGRDSENVIRLKGYVNPPFYKTWWFVSLLILLLFGMTLVIFKRRIKLLKQKQEKEIEHLLLENNLRFTQQSALKAQMNPHFIFNVLNSIKGYIYENDKKNAALYLSRFSDLIRKILEQSSVPQITLQEEIETLKLYIELEAMLLDGKFEYSIAIDKSTYADNILIPALLIQPLVENAFKHGLRHKQDIKKLAVSFSSNKNILTVIIEDNGIGRAAAEKINQRNTRQSFAAEALAQRIKLLNAEHIQTVGIEIIDLKDHLGNAEGTKVVLNIKIEQ